MLLCLVMMSAGATFAVDNAALDEASAEMVIEENSLPAEDIAVETDNVIPAEVTDDNIVTNETFYNYFNEFGILSDNVTYDELIFEGDFSDLGIDYIIILNKSVTLIGSDAVFDGVSFGILSDDVTLDGFTITQTDADYGIYALGNNIVISNNDIDFTALGDRGSYAIGSFASSNLQLLNNTIRYVGNTDGTVVNNAVRISGDEDEETPATSIVVSGNTFDIELPSVDIGDDLMSEGIVFYYCEDLKFTDNYVNVKYNNVTTAYGDDYICAVSVKSDAYKYDYDDEGEKIYPIESSNVLIGDNVINVEGHSIVYGISVAASYFVVDGNNITVSSETSLGHGIDVAAPSFDGNVADNVVVVDAPVSYGIFSDGLWQGPVDTVVYSDNYITVDSYFANGMLLVERAPYVADNTIVATGNYTYGVVASIYEEGEISGNVISVLGSNTGDRYIRNSVGISVDGNVTIDNNTIESTNIGISLEYDGEICVTNNIIDVEANALMDSYGIHAYGLSNLTIADNEIVFVGNTDGTVVNNALRIEGDDYDSVPATSIVVSGNAFDIEIPSVDVSYDPDTWAASVMSEGIVFYYCEDLKFTDNYVNVKYNNVTTDYDGDSIYAVSVKSDAHKYDFDDEGEKIYPIVSSNVLIGDNVINVQGHSKVYGVTVVASYFVVDGNNITVSSETYLGHGIDVAAPSFDGNVADNVIVVDAPNSYGICSDNSWPDQVDTISYVENFITVDGFVASGMLLGERAPYVADNTIVATGNYTNGIYALIYEEGEISGNVISVLGSNTGDSYGIENSKGISVWGNVAIDDNTIESTNIGISLEDYGEISVVNNVIEVEANALMDSYGIYAYWLSNLTIADNEIVFVGNTDGTVVNNALRIEGDDYEDDPVPATSIVVSGNLFDIELPSVDVSYDPDTGAATVMSEGIVFYYCEDLKFMNNTIDLKYNNVATKSGYDSLYAVSVKSDAYTYDFYNGELFYPIQSCDVLIADNTINVEGHSATYAITVAAAGFEVTGNNVTVSSETYLGHGIDVAAPSFDGDVADNVIVVDAPVSYGIYSNGSGLAPVLVITYANNYITVDGYLAGGMELLEKAPYVINNSIIARGNYTYGIVASIYDEGEISCNYIGVLGSNVGTRPTGDSLMPRNSMGISVKGSSIIAENTIGSNNIGINLAGEGNITVDNNILDVEANIGEIDNHAIVASEIDDLVISNNEITYVGASGKTEGGAKDYAIYVSDSEVDVANNTMDIVVQSIPNDWIDVGDGNWVRQSYSEGLVFDGCDFSSLTGNEITLDYNGGSYGSIYAVDVLGCDDFLIDGNSIDATGESYIYGIIVEGDDFIISDNEIWTESEYYANGIDIEESAGGIIDWNLVQSKAPGTVYPIYGGMVGEPSLEITNNEIYGNSYFVVGVELSGLDATIDNNFIMVGGNYTIGIGVYVDELIAGNNTIICDASNVGNVSIWDSIGTDTTGIKSIKGTATIIDNDIEVKGKYSVDIADDDGTVHDNRLVAAKLLGDYSVYSTGDASVYDNYPTLKVVLFATDLDKVYGDGKLFTVTALDENGDPAVNITLFAKAGSRWSYAVTDDKGVAEFDINLPEGTYAFRTIFYGTEVYGPREIENTLTVTAAESEIIAPELVEFSIAEVIAGNATYTLVLVDDDGNAIADRQINITFNGLTEGFTTDENGTVAYVINATAGNYTIDMAFESDGFYKSANASGTVVIKQEPKQAKIYLRNALYFVLQTKIVNVTLWDEDSNPISGKTVHITIGNLTWSGVTDENGTAHIRVGVGFGNHNATVSFDGDDEYMAANRTGVVRVIKETPSLMVRGEDTKFKVTDNPKTVKVYLLDRTSKPLPVGSKVAIKVNGQTYIGYTDASGIASINITINKPGTFNAEVRYGGNSAYNAVTRAVKFYIQ